MDSNYTIQLDLIDRFQGDLENSTYDVIATLRRNLYEKVQTLEYDYAENYLYHYITFSSYIEELETFTELECKSNITIDSNKTYTIECNITSKSTLNADTSITHYIVEKLEHKAELFAMPAEITYLTSSSDMIAYPLKVKYTNCTISSNNSIKTNTAKTIYVSEIINNTSNINTNFGLTSQWGTRKYIEAVINKKYNIEVII